MIKKYLKNSSSIRDVKWSAFQNEARKPVLVVYPGLVSLKYMFFIVNDIPSGFFFFFERYSIKLLRND